MGGTSSRISLANTQSVTNAINNISNESCINSCKSNTSDIHVVATNSTLNNLTIGTVCNIIGASCVLKASLTNTIQNKLTNKQKATTVQESDPLSLMGSFFGETTGTNESSNQSISNRVSNLLNSTCQNNTSSTTDGVYINLNNVDVTGTINVGTSANISKTSCILDNVARTTLSNTEANSQSAKVMQGSPLLFAIIGLVIVAVVIMIILVIVGAGALGVMKIGPHALGSMAPKTSSRSSPRPSLHPSSPPQRRIPPIRPPPPGNPPPSFPPQR